MTNPLAIKKKRDGFYNEIKGINFKYAIEAAEKYAAEPKNAEAYEKLLEEINIATTKLFLAIMFRDKKTDEKSESNKYLREIKGAAERLHTATNSGSGYKKASDYNRRMLTISRLGEGLEYLEGVCKRAANAKFSNFTIGAVLDDKRVKKEFTRLEKDLKILVNEIKKIH